MSDLAPNNDDLSKLVAESKIRAVLYKFARGVDRQQHDLVRECYHPDAIDDHGPYHGGVDGFIAYLEMIAVPFPRKYHFIGNINCEINGTKARVESYVVLTLRVSTPGSVDNDTTVAGRYIDDFELRQGEWKIAHRVVVADWGRVDEVAGTDNSLFDSFRLGVPSGADAVFAPELSKLPVLAESPARSL